MNIRKTCIAVASSIAIALGAYTGYWFYARGIAETLIEDWASQRRADGFAVEFATPRMEGYPFIIRAVLDSPSLARDGHSWRGDRLAIELQPWDPRRYRFDFQGRHEIALTQDGRTNRLALDPAEAAVVVRLSGSGRIAGATLRLRDLRVTEVENGAMWRAAEIWLEAIAPKNPPKTHTDVALTLSLSAADIVLPENTAEPLGRAVPKLRADLRVNGVVPDGSIEAAVEAWRRDGGAVEIDWFHLIWGALDLRAKGTVTLDSEARPLGAFSADIRGLSPALDMLVAGAVLKRNAATIAKIALALLAKKSPDDGASVLTLPVTAQDGRLYAGPIKILDLAPVRFLVPRR
jgi:hypothetical protein